MSLHLSKKQNAASVSSFRELCSLLDFEPCVVSRILEDPVAHYGCFSVSKSDGRRREIRPPNWFLKKIQRRLLKHFYKHLRVPPYLHGGLPKRSIVTHAASHVGQSMVATFDLQEFFPSTGREQVEPILFEAGLSGEALSIVGSLVLLNNALPQGGPTSNLLANPAFTFGDRAIMRLCRKHGLRYSRFVDDFAISGPADIRKWHGAINQIVCSQGYRLAVQKTEFFDRSERQIVTGLVVNDRLRPTKEFVHELKATIRFCIDSGAETYATAEGVSVGRLQQKLNGQVSHVRHVDPILGEELRRLLYGIKWKANRQQVEPVRLPA